MSADFSNDQTNKFGCKRIETPDFDESLVAAFERAEKTFPSRIALASDKWKPTYRELNKAANRLAHRFLAHGVASGHRAAVLMSHDAPMVAAVLGALKAGQIVVPLNPRDPVARLKVLIEDAEPSIVVTDLQNRTLAAEVARSGCHILNFEFEIAMGQIESPSIEILPGETAFLTYTSGTTGRPRGVMKTHRQLCRAAAVHTDSMQYTEHDRNPLLSAVSTGQGTTALWWTLLNGATLCPFPLKTRGLTGLADWIIDHGLTTYASSASVFRTLIKTIDDRLIFTGVRAVWLASESITADDFRAFRKHFPATSILVHGLSSSETSNIAWSRWTRDDDIPEGVFPVGHFSRDMDISLIGDDGEPVVRGEIGEIVVRSRYVAAGYWRDPGLTAKLFSGDLDGKGTRCVRSGDRGRINDDGLLEFCGREGDRINIRGNRVELLDIERTIEKLPGIDRAAVVTVPREKYEPLLLAFVVKTSGASWTPSRLRHAVRANLQLHMMPSKIVFVEDLPYNSGNKIDREALRLGALAIRDESKGQKPRTETETLVADIWAELFELPDISRDADFFNLGGDSLGGAIVATQVHAALGIELSLEAIADHPTVSTLAAFIDERRPTPAPGLPPIIRVPRAASMPLSLFQEHTWSIFRNANGTHVRSYRLIGPLDVEILKESLRYLFDRHEILRTTFGMVQGCPGQFIHSSALLDFSYVDLSDADDAERQADLMFREADSRTIDLEKLPIMRYVLTKIADDHYLFAHIGHLIITDGFSARILDAELAMLYEAKFHGHESPLPKEPPLQYADYAVWQRQIMGPHAPYLNEAVNWWKNVLSTALPATQLPFRRWVSRAGLDPSEGVLQWKLEEQTTKRLDEIARGAGVTNFIVRLAAFAALIADVTGNSTVIIRSAFSSRNRVDAQAIVGPLLNAAPFLFSYDASRTFLEWLEIVRDRVFETMARSDPPFHKIDEQLQALGVKQPECQVVFMMSSNPSDQHFGNLTISNEFWSVGKMPMGCTFYVDRKPEHCRVNFDANFYDPNGMRAMLDRYLRLLEAAAHQPELPIGILLTMIGAKPLRWKCDPFYEFAKAFYASSPLLKSLWRLAKKMLLPKSADNQASRSTR